MISLDTAATEVFQILRSYDYTVTMYDDDGNQIYEPENARRFFATPENLLVSLVDDGDNSGIRLYIGKTTDLSDVLGLDQTLRMTATKYNMIYNMKRTGRELSPADFSSKASVTEGKNMNYLLEGMYGTTRSSYLKLENARMIVRHTKKIDEMIMGSRGRHIDAIFVENAQGERFLFPTQQLAPARAMTQHVNHGGGFADVVGQQILRMANDYSSLGQASQFIYQNSGALQESAGDVRQACRTQMYEMRKTFERLYRANSPDKWSALSEALQERFNTLNEGDSAPEPLDLTEMRELLAVEGKELSESLLQAVAEAVRDCAAFEKAQSDDVEEGRTENGYQQENGTILPFNEWHPVGKGISIMPLRSTFRIRRDSTGEIVKPAGQASKDALMMALYYNACPTGYAMFCFGSDWADAEGKEPSDTYSAWDGYKKAAPAADAPVAEGELDEGRKPALGFGNRPCPKCEGRGGLGRMVADADGEGSRYEQECPACGGSGADTIKLMGHNVSKLAIEDFEQGKLPLYAPPARNGEPRFTTADAKVAFLLNNIIPQVKNDSMANFLSFISDELQKDKGQQSPKVDTLRKLAVKAIHIAKPDDAVGAEAQGDEVVEGENNPVVREFDEWIAGFAPDAVLAEQNVEEAEDYTSYAAGRRDDAEEDAITRAIHEFEPMDFFAMSGDDFGYQHADELEGDDKDYEKSYILKSLSHYLSQWVAQHCDIEDTDCDSAAEVLWPKVKDALVAKGYSLNEELGELSHEDMVIPTDQNMSLKREVCVPSDTDPFTGDEVDVDAAYINRLRTLAGQPWNR